MTLTWLETDARTRAAIAQTDLGEYRVNVWHGRKPTYRPVFFPADGTGELFLAERPGVERPEEARALCQRHYDTLLERAPTKEATEAPRVTRLVTGRLERINAGVICPLCEQTITTAGVSECGGDGQGLCGLAAYAFDTLEGIKTKYQFSEEEHRPNRDECLAAIAAHDMAVRLESRGASWAFLVWHHETAPTVTTWMGSYDLVPEHGNKMNGRLLVTRWEATKAVAVEVWTPGWSEIVTLHDTGELGPEDARDRALALTMRLLLPLSS